MLKKQGSFFNTNHSIAWCFGPKRPRRFKLLAMLCFHALKVRLPSAPCPSDLLVKELFREVCGAWWVSPELRASFPAMLCHGARGSERRRAYSKQHPRQRNKFG